MTRIGTKKKRQAKSSDVAENAWIAFTVEPPATLPKPPPDVWTEEQAKTACAVTLALMLLLGDGVDSDADTSDRKSWYMQCVELACAAPMGSFRNVFWWSLRYMQLHNETFEDVVSYFLWKKGEFDARRIHREAMW